MKLKLVTICCLLFLSFNTFAAAKNKNFALKGAGLLNCKMFIKEREQRSNVYYMIGGWLDGFISAHNKYAVDTYDITSFESSELLAKVIDNHCRSNPDDQLYTVINSIIIKLIPDRITYNSPKIEINVGERKTRLYRETVRRIQSELIQQGHFKGEIDGDFSEDTISALKSFQTSLKFESTGFPDQTTLWRLLHK